MAYNQNAFRWHPISLVLNWYKIQFYHGIKTPCLKLNQTGAVSWGNFSGFAAQLLNYRLP